MIPYLFIFRSVFAYDVILTLICCYDFLKS